MNLPGLPQRLSRPGVSSAFPAQTTQANPILQHRLMTEVRCSLLIGLRKLHSTVQNKEEAEEGEGGLLQHQRSVNPHTGCVRIYDQIWILGRSVNNPSVLVLYSVVIKLGLILILILTNSCHRKINTPARHSNQTSTIPKANQSNQTKNANFILTYRTFFMGQRPSIPIDYNTFITVTVFLICVYLQCFW